MVALAFGFDGSERSAVGHPLLVEGPRRVSGRAGSTWVRRRRRPMRFTTSAVGVAGRADRAGAGPPGPSACLRHGAAGAARAPRARGGPPWHRLGQLLRLLERGWPRSPRCPTPRDARPPSLFFSASASCLAISSSFVLRSSALGLLLRLRGLPDELDQEVGAGRACRSCFGRSAGPAMPASCRPSAGHASPDGHAPGPCRGSRTPCPPPASDRLTPPTAAVPAAAAGAGGAGRGSGRRCWPGRWSALPFSVVQSVSVVIQARATWWTP